jgi:hypothetical protein
MLCTLAQPVLAALVEARREWATVPALAERSRLDEETVHRVVEDLRIRGYLDVWWTKRPLPVVTFSAWGAFTLGYRLHDDGADRPRRRWVRAESKGEPPRRRRPRPREEGAELVDQLADPGPAPDVVAEEAEEADARAEELRIRREKRGLPLREDDVPRPTIILTGHSLATWNETDEGNVPSGYCPEANRRRERNEVPRASCPCKRDHLRKLRPALCPGCRGRELTRSTFCARCRRWGWDPFFHPAQETKHRA